MIQGLNVRCNVGPVEILRSPFIELVSRRRAVVSTATVIIPDPEGKIRELVAVNQPVTVRFGYRGEANFWQEWEGTVSSIDQPRIQADDADAVTVQCVGLEKALTTTMITESFYREPADVVARRLLARTGLAVGEIAVPKDILPYQVFSDVSVARSVRQLSETLTRAYGYDMSRHALWLGANGLTWSAGNEPGDIYSIETAENLIAHTPPETYAGIGVVTSVLMPGLVHSRIIHIKDSRRNVDMKARALDVVHTLQNGGNSTVITYGKDMGWS